MFNQTDMNRYYFGQFARRDENCAALIASGIQTGKLIKLKSDVQPSSVRSSLRGYLLAGGEVYVIAEPFVNVCDDCTISVTVMHPTTGKIRCLTMHNYELA